MVLLGGAKHNGWSLIRRAEYAAVSACWWGWSPLVVYIHCFGHIGICVNSTTQCHSLPKRYWHLSQQQERSLKDAVDQNGNVLEAVSQRNEDQGYTWTAASWVWVSFVLLYHSGPPRPGTYSTVGLRLERKEPHPQYNPHAQSNVRIIEKVKTEGRNTPCLANKRESVAQQLRSRDTKHRSI